MFDYTAIDFETANSNQGSPCSVGLVKVKSGEVVEAKHWLIRPPEAYDYFDALNVSIHNITGQMVAGALRWKEMLPFIMDFIGDDIVVAHNASFDINVIRRACEADNISSPEIKFLCTLVMSRRVFPLNSYSLPIVTKALGIQFEDHHNALSDAQAVVSIVSSLASIKKVDDLPTLAEVTKVKIGRLDMVSGYKGSVATQQRFGAKSEIVPNSDADSNGYLYGKTILVTGGITGYSREEAIKACVEVGARPVASVTNKLQILVTGNTGVPNSKTKKAEALKEQGKDIQILTEEEFFRHLLGSRASSHPSITKGTQSGKKPKASATSSSTIKKPRTLNRTSSSTEQICSMEECNNIAAFKTRVRRTLCISHIEAEQRIGGVTALEPFTHPQSWQLTQCLKCGVKAHVRFAYTLEKNYGEFTEVTCRACFWRQWAADARNMGDLRSVGSVFSYEAAKTLCEQNGYDYLGPLTTPSQWGDPHYTQCRTCKKLSSRRLMDVEFGCSCQPAKDS